MLEVLIRRILVLVPTLIGVSVLAFGLIRMVPGDPVLLMLGERGSDPAAYEEMKANLGLHRPLIEQYLQFVGDLLKGDMGTSIHSKRPVTEEFFSRFPATVELGLSSVLLAIIIGIPFGILAALKRNSFLDYSLMTGSLIGFSMPIFWWGLILILVFSVSLGITPVAGRIGVEFDIPTVTGFLLIDTWLSPDGARAFWDALRHLVLPAVALGTIPLAVVARMTRSSMLEVLGEDYMRSAYAKGLSRRSVVLLHGLRNALIPVVTMIGLMVGTVLTGAILTETIFSWPGIGKWLVSSVNARDYPVIQGGIFFTSLIVIFVNLAVDIAYLAINPRLREVQK